MDQSLGDRLRLHRERQGVALADIAERTKIKLSMLQGLERDDVSRWPSGIFRRSYLRTYARAIGLDPETVVREFVELHPDPDEDIRAVRDSVDRRTGEKRPPTRLRFILESAVGTLPSLRHHAPAASPTMPASTASGDAVLRSVADLCNRLSQSAHAHEIPPILEEAAATLDAAGLVLWIPKRGSGALAPAIVHGYPDDVRLRLPLVPYGADTAIGSAFRSTAPCIVKGASGTTGAVVVPLMRPAGCVGVLALEMRNGGEQRGDVVALATILAAQLASLVPASAAVHAGGHVAAQRAKG